MKTKTNQIFLLTLFLVAFASKNYGQTTNNSWALKWDYPRAFIENKGQFDGRDKLANSKILYAIDHTAFQVFFTKEGLTYHLNTRVKNKDRKKGDITKPKKLIISDFITMTWVGANPDVQLIAEGKCADYHTYSMMSADRQSCYDIRNIYGYKKLTYKNLYPQIDVEYVFHPESGIKYSLILHPGADITQVKMKYGSDRVLTIDSDGNLRIATLYGDLLEHAPVSFYTNNTGSEVQSAFSVSENTVSFSLAPYDRSKTLTLDPWVVMPTNLGNSSGVWELDKDAAGNIYVIGGDMPMKLQKYNAAGALQWTYSTPWDTANNWLGTLTCDLSGNSYITSGSTAAIQKVDASGSMVWDASGGAMDEYWMIVFNCDQSKLIVGGTRLDPITIGNSHGVIFDINPNNGGVNSFVNVAQARTYQLLGMTQVEPNEVRALSSSRDGKYFYLTLDTIGAVNDDFAICGTNAPIFKVSSTYEFAYKCEDFRPNNGNAGIRAIRANKDFVFTQNGSKIDKRDMSTGAILASAPITGGITNPVSMTSLFQPGNSGLAVDSCGNVYAGSADRVIKYDANLNVITEQTLPFGVFDVVVSPGGNVVVCGATGTSSSSSRTGYIQSINMGACNPFQLVCCNTAICPVGPFCPTDPAVTLITVTPGGTWSGPGVDPTTGVFTPSAAGVGTHTITYSLPCGSSTISITVLACAQLEVCVNTDGNVVVSGGTAPYTWQNDTSYLDCSSCAFGICTPPICNGIQVNTWYNFTTGDTIAPPLDYPVRVVDNAGNALIVNDFASIQPCAICSTYTVATSGVTNASCPGGANGMFSAEAYGGTGPYNYVLLLGGTQIVSFPNVSGAQAFTGLAAGTYTVNVYDADNCPSTTTVTIGEDPFTVSANSNSPVCEGTSINFTASGGVNYVWSGPNGYSSTAQNPSIPFALQTMAGTYTVTISAPPSCSDTVTVDVVVNPRPTVDAGQDQTITYGESVTLNGTGSLTFSWTPTGTLSDPTIANPVATPANTTTYILTTTNNFGCSSSDTVVITVLHPYGELFVPNIFSPNDDGKNDIVYVYGTNIKEMKFFIYNRWGEKVFESFKQADGWDGTHKGKPCDMGVFAYYLEVIYLDDSEEKLSGNITLVR